MKKSQKKFDSFRNQFKNSSEDWKFLIPNKVKKLFNFLKR